MNTNEPTRSTFQRSASAVTLLLLLSGCASVNFDQSLAQTNNEASAFTNNKLALAQNQSQRDAMAARAATLLKESLGAAQAVELALVNSPALQALLAQNWAQASSAAQSGRITNPLFSFTQMRVGDELEFERRLSFGLVDLITLPMRQKVAQRELEQAQTRLTAEVVEQVTLVRQAWVKAVSMQQKVEYAQQVFESAQASAELARRMQAAGNFSKLARARQQTFYADSATQLATATHLAIAAREEFIRAVGLTTAQAQLLQLPPHLPELPQTVRSTAEVGAAAMAQRLDVRMAQVALNGALQSQGLDTIASFTDLELGFISKSKSDEVAGTGSSGQGLELGIRLPLFDWGSARRDGMNAQTLVLANQLQATVRNAASSLRENYSAYRTSYDIARHYRDEVLPLSKVISEENVLRYNGMLIGVLELLSDAREQVRSVQESIDAMQQFWMADATLQAAMLGKPTGM